MVTVPIITTAPVPAARPGEARIVTSSGSTHTGSTTTRDLRDYPTMKSVGNLMSVSAGDWHGVGMTMFGGTAVVPTGPSHVPIVIGASPEFTPPGWVERVGYPSVMPPLLLTVRGNRLAVDAARTTGRAA
jgi:hypothetical protein